MTGWPPCLIIIAAVTTLVQDADQLTLGQNLTVAAPHALESIRQPSDCWLTNARITLYHTLLLNFDQIIFAPPVGLNPATLLPNPDLERPLHQCQEILSEARESRKDLSHQPPLGAKTS